MFLRYLREGLEDLNLVLQAEPQARIAWPSHSRQREMGLAVNRRSSTGLVTGRWGFVDGKNYRVQKPSAADVQNAYYNGWLHLTLVTGMYARWSPM